MLFPFASFSNPFLQNILQRTGGLHLSCTYKCYFRLHLFQIRSCKTFCRGLEVCIFLALTNVISVCIFFKSVLAKHFAEDWRFASFLHLQMLFPFASFSNPFLQNILQRTGGLHL